MKWIFTYCQYKTEKKSLRKSERVRIEWVSDQRGKEVGTGNARARPTKLIMLVFNASAVFLFLYWFFFCSLLSGTGRYSSKSRNGQKGSGIEYKRWTMSGTVRIVKDFLLRRHAALSWITHYSCMGNVF